MNKFGSGALVWNHLFGPKRIDNNSAQHPNRFLTDDNMLLLKVLPFQMTVFQSSRMLTMMGWFQQIFLLVSCADLFPNKGLTLFYFGSLNIYEMMNCYLC